MIESWDDDVHLRGVYSDLAVASDIGQVGVDNVQEGHQAYKPELRYPPASLQRTASPWNQAVPSSRQISRNQRCMGTLKNVKATDKRARRATGSTSSSSRRGIDAT